ncbi:MAG TPA: ABC transporter permease, partial [Acidimicrobiales bacterium]|nr:ABC transporter permease [Acidimicrobiales bacterium]
LDPVGPLDDSPEFDEFDRSGTKKKGMGFTFWLAIGWIGLIVFGALFQPVLPLQSTTKPDACSTYAATMENYSISGTAAQLYSNAQADSPQQAQQMADQGVTPSPESVESCPNPTLDSKTNAYPSAKHWLGTDSAGRDTFSRIVKGAQVALLVGVVAVGVGMLLGTLIGMIAGYFRGAIEGVMMTVVDIALAFPALILAIAIVAFRGQSLFNVCLAIAIVATPGFARLARSATLTYSEREFVMAARVMGASHRRIIFRELLPNVALPIIAFYLLAVAIAIVAEGGLAFLGLSVPPPSPSWGTMIQDGYNVVNDSPFVVMVPSMVMFVTVLAFNFVGDRFRERFDVKEAAL